MAKNLVLIGGGEIKGWNFQTKDENQDLYQTENIDKNIVKLTNKANPKLLFIGTASRENEHYFNAIKNIYSNLGCTTYFLKMTDTDKVNKILNADIIYIGGGNTRFMLSEWNKVNLKQTLIEAYNKGTVISGFSAGTYCWFKYNYEMIKGFGVIDAIICVHYEDKSEEKINEFYANIEKTNLPGLALDNGVAIRYTEDYFEIIKSISTAKAYKITYINNEFIKEELFENIKYTL